MFADVEPLLSRYLSIHHPGLQWSVGVAWVVGALACAWIGRGASTARGGWLGAAVVQVLMAIELPLRYRWELSEWFRARFAYLKGSQSDFDNRRLQAIAVVVGVAVVAPLVLLALLRARRLSVAARVVWGGIGVGVLGFVLELISLHQVDALGYAYGLLVAVGALLSTGGWVAAALGAGDDVPGGATGGTSRPMAREDASTIPALAALACLLYVFGHGPVAGHEAMKLVGGLGAALLFAAAGGVGAWASTRVPIARLALFALLFAALGVSFNLALHPSTRPVATADILQGLPLAALAVACWRRWVGESAGGDAALAALSLLAHFLLGPVVPAWPGLQYLFAGPDVGRSLFPLFPWLTMAALGARGVGATATSAAVAAVLLGASTALAWGTDPASGAPAKFPMNLTYALLSCAAIEAAFVLAHALKRAGGASRAAAWLGRNWLVFFYLHFAVAFAVGRLGLGSPWAVWGLLAVGSAGATWAVAKAAAPLSGAFRSPVAWAVPVALVAASAGWPGLPRGAVSGLAGLAGLIFAAHHGTLAYLVANLPAPRVRPVPGPTRRAGPVRPEPVGWGHALVRLAVLLPLLAIPEAVGYLEGPPPATMPKSKPKPTLSVPAKPGPGDAGGPGREAGDGALADPHRRH